MRLIASDIYSYYKPSKCGGRVYLRHRNEPESPPGPYEELLRRLEIRHEENHLQAFEEYVDMRKAPPKERAQRTKEHVANRAPVIYQPVFEATAEIGGTNCEVTGQPDFLVLGEQDYVIRDSKISRRITKKDHPEILHQLDLYGWLYERTFNRPPSGLEVYDATGSIVNLSYAGGQEALALLGEIVSLRQAASEPYSPVGWTKCGGCGYNDHCWKPAVERQDVAIVPGVDQGLATALHESGINTVSELLEAFDEDHLAELHRPWGRTTRKVGKSAGKILLMAKAIESGQEIVFSTPALPPSPNYVMFDVEGIPPHLDELDKIYLWGIQVFGEEPGEYTAATAGFGDDGDREGWEQFLNNARTILDHHGDLPFVHWHHYELGRLKAYIERFGDVDGIAARIKDNLLDLLPVTQQSVALPLPTYSLKAVEKHVGFARSQEEYGGEWSMAKYIEATETKDAGKRQEVLEQILIYNREDLKATWAVLDWLREKSSQESKPTG